MPADVLVTVAQHLWGHSTQPDRHLTSLFSQLATDAKRWSAPEDECIDLLRYDYLKSCVSNSCITELHIATRGKNFSVDRSEYFQMPSVARFEELLAWVEDQNTLLRLRTPPPVSGYQYQTERLGQLTKTITALLRVLKSTDKPYQCEHLAEALRASNHHFQEICFFIKKAMFLPGSSYKSGQETATSFTHRA